MNENEKPADGGENGGNAGSGAGETPPTLPAAANIEAAEAEKPAAPAGGASGFDRDQAQALLESVFAPWVKDLQLGVETVFQPGDPGGAGALLRLKYSDRLCREGGIVCGQALMALADTAMVFAVSAASGRYRPMTTVDQTTHFLKPAPASDLLAEARIVRMGKSMAFGQVLLRGAFDPKPVTMVSSAYALL